MVPFGLFQYTSTLSRLQRNLSFSRRKRRASGRSRRAWLQPVAQTRADVRRAGWPLLSRPNPRGSGRAVTAGVRARIAGRATNGPRARPARGWAGTRPARTPGRLFSSDLNDYFMIGRGSSSRVLPASCRRTLPASCRKDVHRLASDSSLFRFATASFISSHAVWLNSRLG